MCRLARASPELIFIFSRTIQGKQRDPFGSCLTSTPYAVVCQTQVIGKTNKSEEFQVGVALICPQIAICHRTSWENKPNDNSNLF
jgi:hypothetical protein